MCKVKRVGSGCCLSVYRLGSRNEPLTARFLPPILSQLAVCMKNVFYLSLLLLPFATASSGALLNGLSLHGSRREKLLLYSRSTVENFELDSRSLCSLLIHTFAKKKKIRKSEWLETCLCLYVRHGVKSTSSNRSKYSSYGENSWISMSEPRRFTYAKLLHGLSTMEKDRSTYRFSKRYSAGVVLYVVAAYPRHEWNPIPLAPREPINLGIYGVHDNDGGKTWTKDDEDIGNQCSLLRCISEEISISYNKLWRDLSLDTYSVWFCLAQHVLQRSSLDEGGRKEKKNRAETK